jgi:hypothetical protein
MESTAHVERRRLSKRARRLLPWAAAVLLVAGIVVAIVRFAPNRNPAPQSPGQAQSQAPQPPKPKTVPLAKDTTAVARAFLKTAVAREDLDAAWKIAGPNIRGDLTHRQWLTGNIPVVPYPIKSLAVARFKVDWSYANQAGLEVALLPRDNAGVKPQVFFILLRRVGPAGKKHWLVDTWVPKSAPLVPLGANS